MLSLLCQVLQQLRLLALEEDGEVKAAAHPLHNTQTAGDKQAVCSFHLFQQSSTVKHVLVEGCRHKLKCVRLSAPVIFVLRWAKPHN